ncbi:MAG: sigma-70 family RNA polymerase sigma factor, partial [Clostridia bacterium]|nr:sigma-70 family RNA polymerase sigma factor [Clostridia bacterium]
MINKVVICGINTSDLKVIPSKEQIELLIKVKQGDKAAREKIINGNLKLVLSVVQRFSSRGENPDDLFQVGCIGLIKSIDNFDINQDVKFSTYAVPMIIGEIRRYLRDNNSIRVSRSMRDTAYKALSAKEELMRESNREPTIEEIAAKLNLPREEVVIAMEAIVEPISLYEPVYNDETDSVYVMDQVRDKNSSDSNWIEEIS